MSADSSTRAGVYHGSASAGIARNASRGNDNKRVSGSGFFNQALEKARRSIESLMAPVICAAAA
jgi:hypothetical protein